MIQHRSPISGVAAFENKYVATAGYDNQIILWEARKHRPLQRGFHDHLANQCRFSSCGKYLVSAGSDYTARLWSVPQLKLLSVLADHDDDVEMAVIHPSLPLIATASRDHRVRVFDFNGRCTRRFEGHTADVISVEWADRGRCLISSSDDGTLRKWHLEEAAKSEIIDLNGVETDALVASPEGTLYAGNDAGEIIVIDGKRQRRLTTHRSGIKRLVYDPIQKMLLSLSYDRTMNVYQCGANALPTLKQTTPFPAIVWPRSAAFLGTDRLVFGTFGTTYAIYDLKLKKWDVARVQDTFGNNAVLEKEGSLYTVGDAGIVKKDGEIICKMGTLCNFLLRYGPSIVTGGQMGILYDALTGCVLYQHKSPLNCGAVFQKKGKALCIIGTYTGEGLIFEKDRNGDLQLVAEIRLHKNAVKGLAANERFIFSVCATGAAALHGIDHFGLVNRFDRGHDKISNGCANLNGKGFASVSRDLKLRLWNTQGTYQSVASPHSHSIKCIQSSSDGTSIATGAYDGHVAVYDVPQQVWVKVVRPTSSGISSLARASDGRGFWASSYDGEVYKI